ncbi:MAG: hypothetical protein BWX80_03415 [Candidatus Hydrogenedentes bacterium ADurb.Bin101]|nr:MAG: hypothetical protein BWX80_03415 [Candidatus Hydrogenedentes bacterium ADurb.Bin101]
MQHEGPGAQGLCRALARDGVEEFLNAGEVAADQLAKRLFQGLHIALRLARIEGSVIEDGPPFFDLRFGPVVRFKAGGDGGRDAAVLIKADVGHAGGIAVGRGRRDAGGEAAQQGEPGFDGGRLWPHGVDGLFKPFPKHGVTLRRHVEGLAGHKGVVQKRAIAMVGHGQIAVFHFIRFLQADAGEDVDQGGIFGLAEFLVLVGIPFA